MGNLVTLGKRSFQSFSSDKCTTLAAAIAYNTIFAIFPLALFGVAVLGFFMGGAAARQNVVDGITKIIPLGSSGSQALEKTLARDAATGRFCHGDDPTLADICLVPQMANARRFEIDLAPYPTLIRIESACTALPAFAQAAPARQPDAE